MNFFDRESCRLLLRNPRGSPHWKRLFSDLFNGRLNLQEMKAFLLLSAKRGEEPKALWECLKAVRKIETPHPSSLPLLIDVCGTGGDGFGTFNISTLSGFVIAGAGGHVAKHGNRAVSSRAGSSDLMEALGVRIDIPFKKMYAAMENCGLGYFHAPFYHPSFARVQRVRRELGIRTFFNMLGPLVNPFEIRFQLMGVSQSAWMRPAAEMLRKLGRTCAAVVRSQSGLDELSTYEPNDILLIEKEGVRPMGLNPKGIGLSKARLEDYRGGSLDTNRKIALGVLEGRLSGPREDAVLLNSGFALWLLGMTSSIREGIEKSRVVIKSGRAREVLEKLREMTHRKGAK